MAAEFAAHIRQKKKGVPVVQAQRVFTLIEIAIVLVIVGLLLGGVLAGQELITSARTLA